MLNSSRSSNPKPGRWTILATWALVTISLSACQSEESPMGPTSEVLELDPVAATLVDGDTLRIQALSKNGNGSAAALDPSSQVTWESSAPEVAIVEEGLIRGVGPGEARITAVSVSGAKASANITVKQAKESSHGMIPAFPGAEGWGATALNRCRELPLVVHQVTNTDDSGPGSFRDVMMNQVRGDRFDVVVFRTGGLIRLTSEIQRSGAHCLYIAGQTAPGGGISLAEQRLEFRSSDDVVVRHIRHRGARSNAILHRGGARMIYDHITSSWTEGRYLLRLQGEERRPLEAGTVQNSLLYEPDESHSTVLGVTGVPRERPESRRVSVHRNVLMGPGHRMPNCSAVEVSIVNNVVYNWAARASEMSASSECDFISNYHKPGPATPSAHESRRPFTHWDSSGGLDSSVFTWSNYIAGNRNEYNAFEPSFGISPWQDPSREVGCRNSTEGAWCKAAGDPVPSEFRRFTPLADAPIPLGIRPISDHFVDEILAGAGHSRRLMCDGAWTFVRDDVDAERIRWFKEGRGFDRRIRAADMVVPVPARGTPCEDSDGDGLPDAWEERFFGCPTCAHPTAVGRGGYLVVEHYLNGTDPR
jgi:hypothetical protein